MKINMLPIIAKFLKAPPELAVALLLVVSLGGCASHESATSAAIQQRESEVARFLSRSRSLSNTYETRLGLAVAAADLVSKDIAEGGKDKDRVLYNAACTEIAILSRHVTLPITLTTPGGVYEFALDPARASNRWDPATFTKLIPTSKIKNKALPYKPSKAGYGGVLVGVYLPPNPRALYLPSIGVSAPVTAVLNTTPPAQPGQPTRATLALYNSAKVESASIAGAKRKLAADLTAPFAYYRPPSDMGILGMLRPDHSINQEGLFLTQPYDPKKIPLVLIHGLMSDPSMWFPVMAALEADPALRSKYQFWIFAYPSGNLIGYSALQLREALAGMYKVYPQTRDMVIVNHSLGGVISHLQVISPGETLVNAIFKDNAPEIMAMPDDSLVKRGLLFEANPRIARIVFVAAPHRGAPLAINPIGNFGASLIRIPGQLINGIGQGVIQAAALADGKKANFIPNSINGLSPKSPLLVAMNTVPMNPPFHSIIGVAGPIKGPLKKTNDTVVPYWSAHQDAAVSEKIVPYPHTAMFVKPKATDEIKRILRLHLRSVGDGT
jgi:pimeloyl-ACP methyl ester carboxylesterase